VFLTPGGKQVSNLSEELSALSKDFPMVAGELKVTLTAMRKVAATKVAKESQDDRTVLMVATHMSHAPDTASKYYQHMKGENESVAAFSMIGKWALEMNEKMGPREKRSGKNGLKWKRRNSTHCRIEAWTDVGNFCLLGKRTNRS
jgi:hypothetical protein